MNITLNDRMTDRSVISEMYVGVASRPRTLCMAAGPRFEWIDMTPAVRLTDVVSATPAAGNDIHANSKQDRPPREDLR